jgi:twitching motility protein PilT
MAAILQKMLDTRPIHAITIEQPIEYVFKPGKGLISQREVGSDVESFEEGLNEAMRQTPDAILVGEVRTREEAEVAFRATGHGRFVIMSTHGRDGISALQKLLSFFPADEQRSKAAMLSNHLVCVIQQALLPGIGTNKWELAYESFFKGDKPEIAALLADPEKYPALRTMLAEGAIDKSTSMNKVLAKLVADKKVTLVDALAATVDAAGLEKLCKAA